MPVKSSVSMVASSSTCAVSSAWVQLARNSWALISSPSVVDGLLGAAGAGQGERDAGDDQPDQSAEAADGEQGVQGGGQQGEGGQGAKTGDDQTRPGHGFGQ